MGVPLGRNPLILLVEDDAPQREVLEFILRRLKADTLHAANLAEAREQLKLGPDLVIIDFYLQPEAGTDLLEDIPDDIPVMLLTASIETEMLMNKYPRINAALTKPALPQHIRATVAHLLGIPDPT